MLAMLQWGRLVLGAAAGREGEMVSQQKLGDGRCAIACQIISEFSPETTFAGLAVRVCGPSVVV